VHSPNTVANDLPPDVDNRPLARQKRRRTRYVYSYLLSPGPTICCLLATRRCWARIV
jgi:hypothetical protein